MTSRCEFIKTTAGQSVPLCSAAAGGRAVWGSCCLPFLFNYSLAAPLIFFLPTELGSGEIKEQLGCLLTLLKHNRYLKVSWCICATGSGAAAGLSLCVPKARLNTNTGHSLYCVLCVCKAVISERAGHAALLAVCSRRGGGNKGCPGLVQCGWDKWAERQELRLGGDVRERLRGSVLIDGSVLLGRTEAVGNLLAGGSAAFLSL